MGKEEYELPQGVSCLALFDGHSLVQQRAQLLGFGGAYFLVVRVRVA